MTFLMMDLWENSTFLFADDKNYTSKHLGDGNMTAIFDSETSQALINIFETNGTIAGINNTFKPGYNLAKVLDLRRQMEINRIVTTAAVSFGVFTTSLMLYTILRNSKLRTLNNMYYFTMFFSLFGLMVTKFCCQIPLIINDNNMFSDQTCNVCLRTARVFYTSSLAFLTAIALNRMFAICFPSKIFLTGKYLQKEFF